MIKIDIPKSRMEKIKKRHYQYFKNNYEDKLKEYCSKKHIHHKDLYKYISENIRDIIVGEPKVLNEIIKEIEIKFPHLKNKISNKESKVNERLKEIFNYSKFVEHYPIKTKPDRWGAYKLVEELNVNICPYCNRQYVVTYHSDPRGEEEGKTRPTLDHFFAKKKYPYLALSLYNLIPSCKVCNSDLKGSKEFKYGEYIHPYEEGFGNSMKFNVLFKRKDEIDSYKNLKYLDFFFGNSDEFDIKLKEKHNKKIDDKIIEKAKNNKKVFKLEELYQFHKDRVAELIKKNIVYSEKRINELHKDFPQLFRNKEDVLKMIISNYISEDDLDKRILAKLTKDICEELELFNYS